VAVRTSLIAVASEVVRHWQMRIVLEIESVAAEEFVDVGIWFWLWLWLRLWFGIGFDWDGDGGVRGT
jgi:hypothetical protein